MSTIYLSTLSTELSKGIGELNELAQTLESFRADAKYVNGMNGTDPTLLINDALAMVNETVRRVQLVNDCVKEALNG